MKQKIATLVLTIAAIAAIPAAAQQTSSCSFKDWTIPSAGFTDLASINNQGHFVGTYEFKGQYRSFIYNGARHDIAVSNAFQTEVRGINNNDVVAGDFYDSILHRQRGFLMHGSSVIKFDYPGASATIASAINDSSVSVGEYFDGTGYHGFVRYNGRFVSLDHPNAAGTWATGINNTGQISGTYQDSNGANHGFVYNNGRFTEIKFPGADSTSALGIGPDGTVIGNYFKGGYGHGFLYENGVYKNASMGGSQSTIPVGYNSKKTVSGAYVDAAGHSRGFIAINCH